MGEHKKRMKPHDRQRIFVVLMDNFFDNPSPIERLNRIYFSCAFFTVRFHRPPIQYTTRSMQKCSCSVRHFSLIPRGPLCYSSCHPEGFSGLPGTTQLHAIV